MADPLWKERLVSQLAQAIDADQPPGLAAATLARAVVSLVQDRNPTSALSLAQRINELAREFPKSG